MYEATISTGINDAHSLDYIGMRLKGKIMTDNVAVRLDSGERSYLCVACDDCFKKPVEDLLIDSVADVLSLGYKNSYFGKKMCMTDCLLTKVLVDVMCLYDNNRDKNVVKSQIASVGNLALDGLFNFRVKQITEKWEEIIVLTDSYGINDSGDKVVEEFLKYLVDSVPAQYQVLSIVIDEDAFALQDEQGAVLELVPLIVPNAQEEELLLYNVVCRKPRRIRLYGQYGRLSTQCRRLLFNLFEVKIMCG